MKRFSSVLKCAFVVALAGLTGLCAPWGRCASLNVAPPSITNDFLGTIVLSITGLTVGETVVVEQYLDANGNGLIDSGWEPMVRSFTVTDGRVLSIGGVRNVNVPGDDDGATNGQIRVDLVYPGANETLSRIAANYLFRVYDPLGGFGPLTNSLNIAQKVYPQGVSGRVVALGSASPLTNAVVVLAKQDGAEFGVVADADGNFTLYSPPGDYFLVAVQNGSVDDQSAGGVTIDANSIGTKHLTNLVANRTISGKVSDSASGLGLPGIFVQGETGAGLFSLAFSDGSGNFTLPATPGQWKAKVGNDSGLAQLGYLSVDAKLSADSTSGSVSNLNFPFAKATALIYGSVKDNLSNAVAGLAIQGNDFSFTYNAGGQTLTDGSYALAVFASSWNIGPDNQALAAGGMIGQGANVTVTNDQALRQDFTVSRAVTHLRGRVIDNGGAPLENVKLVVQLFTNQGPGSTSVYPLTEGDGSFDAGVSPGHWNIALECNSAADHGVVSPSLYFDVVDGVDQTNIMLITKAVTAQITGVIHDNHGSPFNAQVYASLTLGGTNYSTCGGGTDAGGNFQIAVCNGPWQVGISGDLTSRGFDNPPNQIANVSGSSAIANITVYPLGQTPPSILQPTYVNGHFQFRVNGNPEQKYRIEACTNLHGADSWFILRTNTAFGGVFDFGDTNAPSGVPKFYRAVLIP